LRVRELRGWGSEDGVMRWMKGKMDCLWMDDGMDGVSDELNDGVNDRWSDG
jgi:hypothetical protein